MTRKIGYCDTLKHFQGSVEGVPHELSYKCPRCGTHWGVKQ